MKAFGIISCVYNKKHLERLVFLKYISTFETMGNLLQLKEISMPVFILVMFFAMSSWIDLYGVYVEIPYFVTSLPEGWALPSQLGMAVDAANIAPLLYLIAVKLCPGKIKEWPIILIIIGVGMAMCLSLVFLWDQTASIAGKERSVGLLSAASILALVDCTSSVVYIPYMAKLKTQYLTAYFIGEGFGSLIPGLVGLVQGIGSEPNCVNSTVVNFNETIGSNITEWKVNAVYDPPRFSVEVYFLFLFGTVSLSGISFLILHFSPFCKKEHIEKIAVDDSNTLNEDNKVELLKKSDHNKPCEHDPMNTDVVDFLQINTGRFIVLLILTTTLIFSIFGTLFIIIPYSAMPYGMYKNMFCKIIYFAYCNCTGYYCN